MNNVKNLYFSPSFRRGARVAEEARLESVCAPKAYRGFESLSLRILIFLLILTLLIQKSNN